MKAVILAGGRGTRLTPITFVLPKPLVPVGEVPILEIVMRQLKRHGFNDVTLTLGYLAELIQAFFHQHRELAADLNLQYVVEDQPTGTAGSLRLVPGLREHPDPFLVMNGDVLTTLDFRALYQAHSASGADLTIATHQKRVTVDLGVLDLEDQPVGAVPNGLVAKVPTAGAPPGEPLARVTGYIEKPEKTYPVSMGVYVYSPSVLDLIEPDEYLDFPALVLRLLDRGGKVLAYRNDALWLDIGRPQDYEQAQRIYAERRADFLPESVSPRS